MIMNNTISVNTKSVIATMERDLGHARGGKTPLHSIGFKSFAISDNKITGNDICVGIYVWVTSLSISFFTMLWS